MFSFYYSFKFLPTLTFFSFQGRLPCGAHAGFQQHKVAKASFALQGKKFAAFMKILPFVSNSFCYIW